jgi:hypothetical protein
MPYDSNRRNSVGAVQQMIQASGQTRESVSKSLGISKTSKWLSTSGIVRLPEL